jgi:hypothetical protein
MEPQMMQALLGVKVTREKYILRNDPLCAYLVHAGEQPVDLALETAAGLSLDSSLDSGLDSSLDSSLDAAVERSGDS